MSTELSQAYLECALWSSIDVVDGMDVELDSVGNDLAPDTRAEMEADCVKFEAENSTDLWEYGTRSRGGHDFWLTRNGHGAGFWEDDTPVGNRLTEACKAYGEYTLYIGDDGLIYGA